MKTLITLFLSLFVLIAFAQEKPVVVVELFTSEGCSSCPPADRLLSRVIDSEEDVEVLGLSFHVDYWDYIGWKDPYASKDFTRRQRVYGRKFQNSSIYTPQMVVNGKHEFVGSNSSKLADALRTEKAKSFNTAINLSEINLTKSSIEVTVSAEGVGNGILNVAIVERELSQKVTRGENTGRTLAHDNVVRAYDFRQFDGQSNTFSMPLPKDLVVENASLIVYSQNEEKWYVNAATKIDLIDIK